MNIKDILKKPEGRRLEFKENSDNLKKIVETVIAFSNSSGGKIYIGVKDKTREVIGIDNSEIIKLEEKISNAVFDNVSPFILTDIMTFNIAGRLILVIAVYPGSNGPYFLKDRGKVKGTIIRVGSTNRKADEEIIMELERRKRNISFDAELSYDTDIAELDVDDFFSFYKQETGKSLDLKKLESLNILKKDRDKYIITNAVVLLSSNSLKNRIFPYSKVECARFKGTSTKIILDQQTINTPVYRQPEEVMNFIKRNIALGSIIGEVYRKDRWEYPLDAVREAVINAVIHRDYSILGGDIKIAIFDDMLEITSPGTLLSGINIDEPENNPSEIRNRILAPVFKDCGLIEQWGSGFKKITSELGDYPEIDLKLNEPGLSFQLQFIKREYIKDKTTDQVTDQVADQEIDQVNDQVTDQVFKLIKVLGEKELSSKEIMKLLDLIHRPTFRDNYIHPALEGGILKMTNPEKPNSPKQKYFLTKKGIKYFEEME